MTNGFFPLCRTFVNHGAKKCLSSPKGVPIVFPQRPILGFGE